MFNSPKCIKSEQNRVERKPNKLITNGSGMGNQQEEESVEELKKVSPKRKLNSTWNVSKGKEKIIHGGRFSKLSNATDEE